MSFGCSVIAIELAIRGDVFEAIIVFWIGIIIDAMIIDTLETLTTIEGGEDE